MPAGTKIFSFESTLGPKTPSKRLKIAIFGGDAKSSQKIATFKVAIANTFASPSRFQNSHFGDLSPRLATLIPLNKKSAYILAGCKVVTIRLDSRNLVLI